MDSEIKEKWVAALRGGEFEQGQGALSEYGNYCCLGVLCELAVKDGVIEKCDGINVAKVFYDSEVAVLPGRVVTWAGLGDENPCVDVSEGRVTCQVALAELNDGMYGPAWSFAQIADVIEAQL